MSDRIYDPWGFANDRESDPDFVFIGGRTYPRWANGSDIRDRDSHPYSYSFFITHGPDKKFEGPAVGGAYSDRMQEWNRGAWEAAWSAVAPKRHYRELSLADLSLFLTRYWSRETKCLQVLEGCNVSNGYPLWHFVWDQPAQGMAAATAGETGTGSTEGNSPVGEADAPTNSLKRHPLTGDEG